MFPYTDMRDSYTAVRIFSYGNIKFFVKFGVKNNKSENIYIFKKLKK